MGFLSFLLLPFFMLEQRKCHFILSVLNQKDLFLSTVYVKTCGVKLSDLISLNPQISMKITGSPVLSSNNNS